MQSHHFLDYIEGIIERRNSFTMEAFADSVNKFLAFNEYQVLEGYGRVTRKAAEQKAHLEYEQFNKHQKIESDFDRDSKKNYYRKKIWVSNTLEQALHQYLQKGFSVNPMHNKSLRLTARASLIAFAERMQKGLRTLLSSKGR